MPRKFSVCRKVTKSPCSKMSQCLYVNKTRKYCRKSGAKTCRGKTRTQCGNLPKCQYTKGKVRYCRKRQTKKTRKARK